MKVKSKNKKLKSNDFSDEKVKVMLLAAEVMLLHADVMLLQPEKILLRILVQ